TRISCRSAPCARKPDASSAASARTRFVRAPMTTKRPPPLPSCSAIAPHGDQRRAHGIVCPYAAPHEAPHQRVARGGIMAREPAPHAAMLVARHEQGAVMAGTALCVSHAQFGGNRHAEARVAQ